MDYPRVGVGILIAKDGRVLLMRRVNVHGAGSWSTPGGHLEPGETPEDCAQREALEETGLVGSGFQFLAITNDVFQAEGRHYITISMVAEAFSGEAILAARYEADQVGWFTWNDLPKPLFVSLYNLVSGQSYPKNAIQYLFGSTGANV